jgi:hypothetical protein
MQPLALPVACFRSLETGDDKCRRHALFPFPAIAAKARNGFATIATSQRSEPWEGFYCFAFRSDLDTSCEAVSKIGAETCYFKEKEFKFRRISENYSPPEW